MIRKHDQTPETPDTALRRRLDGVDERLAQLDHLADDVTAFGRGLGELTNRVTALGEATTRNILTAPDRHAPGADPGPGLDETTDHGDEDGPDGQPDWLTVTDPDLATQWLGDALVFVDDVLARFPRGRLPACWPVHEIAVVEVIALHRQWVDAYTGAEPGAVSDLLGRWLPGAVHRLGQLTGECGIQRAHHQDGHTYQIPHLDPGRVALWWVESRGVDPSAPVAFAMTAVT